MLLVSYDERGRWRDREAGVRGGAGGGRDVALAPRLCHRRPWSCSAPSCPRRSTSPSSSATRSLVGSVYPVELIMERRQWFESSEIKVVTVSELLEKSAHRHGMLAAYEEGSTYGCGNEKGNNKSFSPRLGLLVVAYGDRTSVVMVFFGDLARDLVGKPDDLLVVDHYGLILTVPKVTKIYPQGSLVFVGLSGLPLPGATGVEAAGTMLLSAGSSELQEIGSSMSFFLLIYLLQIYFLAALIVIGLDCIGSRDTGGQTTSATSFAIGGLHIPPPVILETQTKKSSVDADAEQNNNLADGDSEENMGNVTEKRESTAKMPLFMDDAGKSVKKSACKGK